MSLKPIFLLVCICVNILVFPEVQAQAEKNDLVVKIQSEGVEGEDEGTGFIVGATEDSLFILTARHVVFDIDNDFLHEDIQVEFYDSDLQKLPATLLTYETELDLAVVGLAVEDLVAYIPYQDTADFLIAAALSKEYKDHPIENRPSFRSKLVSK